MGTVTSDASSSSAVILYTTDDETWTVNPLVTIESTNDSAVDNQGHANSVLINNGNILSSIYSAVSFTGGGGQITNNAGHNMTGYGAGVAINAPNTTVTNHGLIVGLTNSGILFGGVGSQNVFVNNDGAIYGRYAGVDMHQGGVQHTAGGAIHNSGLINGEQNGVAISFDSGLTATITNAAGGVIKGPDAAITVLGGRLSLDNSGTISGLIKSLVNQQDSIINRGKILGEVHLGDGNDNFTATGHATAGKVFGEGGVDHLIGANAADQFDGGAGADNLTGGRGRDLLSGGPDNDTFDFNSIKESVKGANRDRILDFSRAEGDRIDLSTIDANTHAPGNQAFHWIGGQAFHSHGAHHVYAELRYQNHIVSGDVNGDGKADFEIWVNAASLAKGDFIL